MKNIKKNAQGYGYKYTDLAEINSMLGENNCDYIQRIVVENETDYIETKRCIDGIWEDEWIRGCRVIQATLSGKNNPAQEQGSGLTYARRYSLLMAFGLATTDDDAQIFDNKEKTIENDLITTAQEKALRDIANKVDKDHIIATMKDYGYEKFAEIKQKDYIKIVKNLESGKKN